MEQHEIRKRLKKELDKGRYEHTKGVMYTAGCMAMAYETSIEQAMLAGLLHDCAKCIPNEKKLKICVKNMRARFCCMPSWELIWQRRSMK